MTRFSSVSVVVPLYNEERNLVPLVRELHVALAGLDWELLLVDDGSTDASGRIAEALAETDPRIRAVRLACNYGQTTALQAGFDHARGDLLVSMDGDLQNDPADIPRLLEMLKLGYDLVAGYRVDRKDRLLTRRLPSVLANRLIARVTSIPVRDNGCTLKAYRRRLLERLELYADRHRFIPALAASHGARIAQIPVRHRPRRFGKSKYGLSRTFRVLIDLLALRVVTGIRRRPRLVFSVTAPLCFVFAFGFLVMWIVALTAFGPNKAEAVVFPGAALLCAACGLYLLMLGLVAEAAVASADDGGRDALVRELS